MPRVKLTKTAISNLKAPDPSGKQVLYWDTELKGFGVLCSGKTNSKTFIVQRDVNRKARRLTIAPTNVLPLDKARIDAATVLADMHRGIDPKEKLKADRADNLTLRQALDKYLLARKDLKPKTVADYRGSVDRYLSDWLDKPLREITPDMVEERHNFIQAEVSKRSNNEMTTGNATANGTMRVLRLLWNHAKDRAETLPDNPVRRLRRAWYPEKRREGIVRASDLPVFYEAVNNLQNQIHRDYLLLILFTGLRRNEAAALRWDELDFEERFIRLTAARTKSNRRLDLPMSDVIYDLLLARREIGIDGPHVFSGNSRSGHIEEPRFALQQVAASSGIKVTVHDLRRTFVTVAESCGLPFFTLKTLVGHSTGSDVTAGYVITGPERLREPMQRVTDRFKKLIGIRE